MDRDGTGQGFQMDLLTQLPDQIEIPIILAGGAGNFNHLAEGLCNKKVDAVATAHLFNFVGDGLERARIHLLKQGFNLTEWNIEKAMSLKGILQEIN